MVRFNEEQLDAIHSTQGNVLVLAGAGSGKTSVLIERTLHLMKNLNIDPQNILALTFTNKAAEEMRSRIAKKTSKTLAKEIGFYTFHGFCYSVLRSHITHLGYQKNFSVYDEGDMRRLIHNTAKSIVDDPEKMPAMKEIHEKLNCKQSASDKFIGELNDALKLSLKTYNAVNFDGLLELTLELFEKHPDVLCAYQNKFHYVMIDEYQDTNEMQFKIVSLLAQKHKNLCVVGDDDQCIYSFRGSDVNLILNFDHQKKVTLDQNYRSTAPILNSANSLIAHNQERYKKILQSQQPIGDPIHLFHAPDEKLEAETVVQKLIELKQQKGLNFKDFAILYRSNKLAKPLEVALIQQPYRHGDQFLRSVPYSIVQGTEFFEKSEVKDIISYLKVLLNPLDHTALVRIINQPRRGISIKTLEHLINFTKIHNTSLWMALLRSSEITLIKPNIQKQIASFVQLIREYKERFKREKPHKLLEEFVEEIDYKSAIDDETKSKAGQDFRFENIKTLISMVENLEAENLESFLGSITLNAHRGKKKKDQFGDDRVQLMTFHASKGLEFKACFLIGLEESILPHEKCESTKAIEEERRLFYVAMTRAKSYLTLSMAKTRLAYNKKKPTTPSRFLHDIEKTHLLIDNYTNPAKFIH
jgi:DNA helicase II / ATP-dependent DNA helicase PcrA